MLSYKDIPGQGPKLVNFKAILRDKPELNILIGANGLHDQMSHNNRV